MRFTPAKQRGHIRTSSFLIPRGETSNGVCFAKIIEDYRNELNYDNVLINPDCPFLYTGRCATLTKPSRYINSPIGENALRTIGKDIANFLGLENPEKFTGHCFRR